MCSVIPIWNRISSSWSLNSGSSRTLSPGGRGQVADRLLFVGLPPFLVFVLLPVEGLFCDPLVVQGLITESTSAPAQMTMEIRPLPHLLCPTPVGGSWGMRNAEIPLPHSLWNCLECYLAPVMTSRGSGSRQPLTAWMPCQATAEGCVWTRAQKEATGSLQTLWTCGNNRAVWSLPDWGSGFW